MRQQNNGRRRQNRGSNNRRSYSNSSANINKNTVLDSSGPDTRQRGTASQLNDKYSTLALDASASDDRILAECFRQFADHYYRLNQEIELNNEVRENKINTEKVVTENNNNNNNNNNNDVEIVLEEKSHDNQVPRQKKGFQAKEKELLDDNIKDEVKQDKNNKDKVIEPQLDIN